MDVIKRASVWLFLLPTLAVACASSSADKREPSYTVIKNPEVQSSTGGIPGDKLAEIQLVMQNREPSARKCYQDVLNEKHDRSFQGVVKLQVTLRPAGQGSQASDVKITSSTLHSPDVEGCLADKIKEWEFPALESPGDVEYEYHFQPAY